MTADVPELAAIFLAATRALAGSTGSLQDRLADAYADHLLQVVADDLPPELRPVFRELEERMNAVEASEADDPFRAAAQLLTGAEARALIDRVVLLFGHLAGLRAG